MTIPIEQAAINLAVALSLSAVMALNVNGERTNNVCFLLQPKCFFD